ncbi:MAG: SGNH/GDSL hydrolase family protein [Treponema sp.]|nr:SGNH/GDSL hydrolase family protein [Treponema sp.]
MNKEKYNQNIENAIYSLGNNFRTKKLIEKLMAGEKVFVAAMGGSVTEGAGPLNPDGSEKWTRGYAFQFVEKLKEKYPRAEVVFDGTGLSGTPSALGVIRYEKDVIRELGESPDLLILEFSVNDGGECTGTRGFERIIRNVLEAKEDGLVIPLYAHATYENTQGLMIPVADFYKLPQVSIRNALEKPDCGVDLSKNGEFFADYVHPTEAGHEFMADCLMAVLEKSALAALDEKARIPAGFYNKNAFENFGVIYANSENFLACEGGNSLVAQNSLSAEENSSGGGREFLSAEQTECACGKILVEAGDFCGIDANSQSIKKGGTEFPENWYRCGAEKTGNEPFRLELECKTLIIAYKHQGHWLPEEFGKAQVFVDGVLTKTFDGNAYGPNGEKSGWNDCVTELLVDSSDCEKHVIEIKMTEGCEKQGFTILAFGYSK